MIFVDTSVIVAALTPSDHRHEACIDVLAVADKRGGSCAAHTLAEVYSVLTSRPMPFRTPPTDAAELVAHAKNRLTTVILTPDEYLATMQGLARLGHSGGMIYDALLIACARKIKATRIYTLNQKHFRQVAPDLASRILLP